MTKIHRRTIYKKDLHNPDNHDGMINHLEPDTLECEVNWAFGSITMNKASGGDGIPATPLALFIVMLLKAHLTSHSKMSGSR